MKLKDITRWNARVSLVYAIGIWTLFGAFGYHQMSQPKPSEKDEKQNPDTTPDEEMKDPATEHMPEGKKPKGFFSSTVVYRDGFVPYSSRILSALKSLIPNGNETESQTNEK